MNDAHVDSPPAITDLTYVRSLGSGGYADVHLYRQHLPERDVAVKVMRTRGAADAHRFTAEANAMATLADHPYIVAVFSAGTADDGRPYLVMSYYPHPNLAVRSAGGRLSVAEVLRIGIQIAGAVETAHQAGILHRDIKPANVLTSQYDSPGLTDFGIAAHVRDLTDDADTGVSVPWSPPEVLFATAPASVASDVYSLGATLWHLLVGRSPFEIPGGDNSPYALMSRIRDLPVPRCARPGVPASLDRLLGQTMAKRPEQRPSSAANLALALQTVERELGLEPTKLVLPAVAEPQQPTGSAGDATHVRSPQVVADTNPRPRATRAAPVRPSTPPAQPTIHRPVPPTPQPAPVEQPVGRRRLWPVLVGIGAVLVAVVVGAMLMFDGPKQTPAAQPPSAGTNQDAGQLGENEPPGVPTMTATRIGPATVTFTWTYAAQLANDTYAWQTPDGKRTGVVRTPTLRLPDSAGTTLCVQVKVVRADGSDATADWSPAGCVN